MRTHSGPLMTCALVGATAFGCGGSRAARGGNGQAGVDGSQTGGGAGATDAGTSTGGQPGAGGSGGGGAAVIARPWDWAGVIGTGQSLAVGAHGTPITTTTQPYHNLKLSTGALPWPIDPSNTTLAMTPLIEPVGRPATAYPSSWPTNIDGETAHASMGNEITALVRATA